MMPLDGILITEQYVQMEDIMSSNRNIDCGIPQGSILGHKLFILYISVIYNISEILKFTLSADDANIFTPILILIFHTNKPLVN